MNSKRDNPWLEKAAGLWFHAGVAVGIKVTTLKNTHRQFFLLAAALAFNLTVAHAADDPAPRLVPQITVDQLRGDLPGRYVKNTGEGGYRYSSTIGTAFVVRRVRPHLHEN